MFYISQQHIILLSSDILQVTSSFYSARTFDYTDQTTDLFATLIIQKCLSSDYVGWMNKNFRIKM